MAWRNWIRTVEIVPAFRPGQSSAAPTQAEALLRTGARILHVEVGEDLLELALVRLLAPIVRRYEGVLDVAVAGPVDDDVLSSLAEAGASSVTFELGQLHDVSALIDQAHALGMQAGVSFTTATDPTDAARRSDGVDLVRCSGDNLDDQLRALRLVTRVLSPATVVAVSGGITNENARELYDAGARVLLVGTSIFDREDLPRAYRRLVQALA